MIIDLAQERRRKGHACRDEVQVLELRVAEPRVVELYLVDFHIMAPLKSAGYRMVIQIQEVECLLVGVLVQRVNIQDQEDQENRAYGSG